MNKLKEWIIKKKEYLFIVVAILLFLASAPIFRMIDPTAGVYDIGVLQNNITAIISLLVFQFIAWNILCFIWPSIRIYFEENFTADFNKLLPWQKIVTSLLLYCFLVFCQVLLSKTISG
jgi:hypothetical protein